jgi:hypothetical protein
VAVGGTSGAAVTQRGEWEERAPPRPERSPVFADINPMTLRGIVTENLKTYTVC